MGGVGGETGLGKSYLRAKQHFSRRMAYTVKHTKIRSSRRLPAARHSSVAMGTGSETQHSSSGGISEKDRSKNVQKVFLLSSCLVGNY